MLKVILLFFMEKTLFLIGSGSFIGGVARYLLSCVTRHFTLFSLPVSNLVVNLVACFAIGLLDAVLEGDNIMRPGLRLFLVVGFCGGFSTFSSFMSDNYNLIKTNKFLSCNFYIFINLLGGFLMLSLGYYFVNHFFAK